MKKEDDITRELEDWNSPLAQFPRHLPFSLPQGYFEGLPTEMLHFLEAEGLLDSNLPREIGFEVPEGYFESLADQMLSGVKAEVEFEKTMPFEVPAGYFHDFPAMILDRIQGESEASQPSRTIAFPRFRFSDLKWAAAAIILVFFSLGAFQRLGNQSAEDQMAKLPDAQLYSFAYERIDDLETELIVSAMPSENETLITDMISQIDPERIESYLESQDPVEDL